MSERYTLSISEKLKKQFMEFAKKRKLEDHITVEGTQEAVIEAGLNALKGKGRKK